MPQGFLQQTAQYLWQTYGTELQDFCLVFPNKRASLFFNKWLSQCTGQPIWAPEYRSIDSLMSDLAELRITDRLQAAVTLYRTFRDLTGSSKSFDEFYHLGELILNDFNEIDKQLAPAGALFRNMADLGTLADDFSYLTPNQIEAVRQFWTSFGEQTGDKDLKKNFSGLWPLLAPLYQAFRERLAQQGNGYEGMVYRTAAERIGREGGDRLSRPCYVFIGFHALTKSETVLFDFLKNAGKALFFWDYDNYYMNRDETVLHEAGRFLLKYLQRYPMPTRLDTDHLTQPKDWRIIAVPSETGQARMAGTLLQELARTAGQDWSRTAVVLPDEQMLQPMLSCIPPEIGKINITMGHALSSTPVCSLYDSIFQLQRTCREADGEPLFHHQAVRDLWMHPYLHLFAADALHDAIDEITRLNLILLTRQQLTDLLVRHLDGQTRLPLPPDVLQPWLTSFFEVHRDQQYADYLKDLTQTTAALMKRADDEAGASEFLYPVTYLYTAYTALQRLTDTVSGDLGLTWDAFARLFRQYTRRLRIPFSGEPLQGLQIMGMLETRTLDFDHVIILSMNENIMPPASAIASLIPYSFRAPFGLSDADHQDSLHAYCFYRLMQRAGFIRCLWFTNDTSNIEKSRFLTQLQFEPAFHVEEDQVVFTIKAAPEHVICQQRSDETELLLSRFLTDRTKGSTLSPSAVNTYMQCRLKFYFQHLKGMKEPEKTAEEIDPRLFGNIFHKTMQKLYGAQAGPGDPAVPSGTDYGHIDHARLQALRKDGDHLKRLLQETIEEEFYRNTPHAGGQLSGQLQIVSGVLLKYMRRLLETEIRWGAFTPVMLEGWVSTAMPLATRPGIGVRIGGIVDRMDWHEGRWRILDYKTGRIKKQIKSLENLFDRDSGEDLAAARQLMLYARILSVQPDRNSYAITPGIVSLRELFQDDCDYRLMCDGIPVDDFRPLQTAFDALLQPQLEEIFCSDQPFDQTTDRKRCEYCPFKVICRR
ncbi:MAG: PD-(D/E)XK nuclease family protein [Bacteroidales bacterium]|nr:PD-(D/E)XK nuclease family protein [Bacteroidales bacterium]